MQHTTSPLPEPCTCASRTSYIETADNVAIAARPPIQVRGWASDNFVVNEQPTVVIDPNADALSLLSWGFGQMQQVNVALSELSAAGYSHEMSQRTLGCLLHFSMQAETVLRAGIEKFRKLDP